jgi:hypothetical protein
VEPVTVEPVKDLLDVMADQLAEEHKRDGIVVPRQNWRDPSLYKNGHLNRSNITFEEVWERITMHEGETFFTRKGLPFTYKLRSGGIISDRNGFWIAPSQFKLGFERVPLGKPSDLAGLWGSTTMYSLLMDKRIRETDW